MTYATTFSGIGGWEIGLDQCGWELKWQCEKEPWCQALLKERFGVPVYGDITTLVEANPPAVDVLIGSPPCQPFSVAGPQRGTSDERHLYPSFLRAVGFLKPRWVLMEQVPAILSLDGGRAFTQYVGGLAALGYDLIWHCIPACAVGASHRRDRLWIIAYSQGSPERRLCLGKTPSLPITRIACKNVFHATSQRFPDWSGGEMGKPKEVSEFERSSGRKLECDFCGVAHGISHRLDRLKGLGNAVVPAIPRLIGQAIDEVEGASINL